MKVVFLSNNKISNNLISWLKTTSGEDVITYNKPVSTEFLKKICPDFIISYNYKYIIKEEVVDRMKGRIINLHISLLPYNRGADPNAWSFLESTPRGITIHMIDKSIDKGPILVQKEVFINENKETLRSSYEKLHKEIQELFRSYWNDIKYEKIKPKPQNSKGSMHHKKDFKKIEYLLSDKGWDTPIMEFKKRYESLIRGLR